MNAHELAKLLCIVTLVNLSDIIRADIQAMKEVRR